MKISGVDPVKQGIHNSIIFRPLSSRHREKIAAIAVLKHFRKGEFVFREGMTSVGFYVICHGAINVHRLGDDGTERIIRLFRAGESFAEASLLPTGKYPSSARAEMDSQLVLIPRNPFLALVAANPDFALNLVVALSTRIHDLVSTLDNLRNLGVRDRLLTWILSHRPAPASTVAYTIHLDLSKASLAIELGIRQETLSRYLASFRKQGTLAINGREIRVLKPGEIEASLRVCSPEPKRREPFP